MPTEPTITLRIPVALAQKYAAQIETVCPDLAALLRGQDDDPVPQAIRDVLRDDPRGSFLKAVKIHREMMGSSLQDAVEAVRLIQGGGVISAAVSSTDHPVKEDDPAVMDLVRDRLDREGFASAVQLHQELTGTQPEDSARAVRALIVMT
jgi:hypothetical protein